MNIISLPDEIDYAPELAADSPVRAMGIRNDHILFRPYSPRGHTASGLWLERNPRHPKIWGWLLAVSRATRAKHPGLVPGAMLIVRRSHGEEVATDKPVRSRYIGHTLPVATIPLAAIQLSISPAIISMDAA